MIDYFNLFYSIEYDNRCITTFVKATSPNNCKKILVWSGSIPATTFKGLIFKGWLVIIPECEYNI